MKIINNNNKLMIMKLRKKQLRIIRDKKHKDKIRKKTIVKIPFNKKNKKNKNNNKYKKKNSKKNKKMSYLEIKMKKLVNYMKNIPFFLIRHNNNMKNYLI